MSLDYIRQHYGVPAELGGSVDFEWPAGHVLTGTIVGARDARLLVDFGAATSDGPAVLHPTWHVTYRPAGTGDQQ